MSTPLSARERARYSLLMGLRGLSRTLYDFDFSWIGKPDPDSWGQLRLVLVLHHTSLLEPLFVGGVPPTFLQHWARHGVAPVAQKTLQRPIVGRAFQVLIPEVVSVSRKPDHTWEQFLNRASQPEKVVVMFPEGRMKRKTGRDKHGKRMSVRGGVADLIRRIETGTMMIAYSGGLHHVHAPGEAIIRPFRTLRMKLETLDITEYRQERKQENRHFKKAVVDDLEKRLHTYCSP